MALTLGACGAIRFGELDPPEGRQMVVGVSVHGAKGASSGAIEDGLSTYEDNLSVSADKPLLNRTALPSDARRIESIEAAHGYFQARVARFWVEERSPELARVHFEVEPGEPTRVSEVRIDGLIIPEGADEETRARLQRVIDRLEGLVDLDEGDVWTEEAYQMARIRLKTALKERGFLFAEVVGDVYVLGEEQQAIVHLQVAPGPLTRISELRVVGNKQVSTPRIMRRVSLAPGQILETRALRETESDIYALRGFFGVGADPVRPALKDQLGELPATYDHIAAITWPREVPVEISVQEMPTHEIRSGVGATITNQKGEAYVSGGYQNRNLFGGRRFFEIDLRPKLIMKPSFIDPDADRALGGEANLMFIQPSFFEEYLEFGTRLNYELDVEEDYKAHELLGMPSLSRRFFGHLTVMLGYSLSWFSFFDYEAGLNLPATETLGLDFRESYLIAAIEEQVALDYRDVVYDARRGFYASLKFAESIRAVGSDFTYLRALAELRGYWTPWPVLTLAAQARWGQVFADGSTPMPARFTGGGPSDMRGFGSGRMGPYVCVEDGAVTASGTDDTSCQGTKSFIGGTLMGAASVEARVYLPASFGLTAFVDAGEIWADLDDLDPMDLNVAVGPGLRYYTPFGPIRLDFGFLVTDPDPGRFSFHFSIGQAF